MMDNSYFKFQKYTYLIIISLTFSFILFSHLSPSSTPPTSPIRTLISNPSLESICKQTSDPFRSFYNENTLNYIYQIHSKRNPKPLTLFIETKKLKHLKEYIPRLIPYLIFCIIFILFLFCFITYCFICCCCPNCCSYPKSTHSQLSNCCSCTFITAIIHYVLIIVFVGVDVFLIKYIHETMNEAVCSLLMVPYSLEEGIKNERVSNWKGTSSSITVMNATLNLVNDIIQVKIDNSSLEKLEEKADLFKGELNNIEKYVNKSIKHPNPNINEIHPDYVKNKLVGVINESQYQFKENVENSMLMVYNVVNVVNDVKYYKDDIMKNYNGSISKLKEVDNFVFNYVSKKGNKIMNFQKDLNKYGYFIFFICLCVLAFFTLCGMISTILYAIVSSCQSMKYVINMSWVIMMILTTLNFIYGISFGIIGIISIDYSLIINNASLSENLNSDDPILIHNTNVSHIIDNCVNKNGNLTIQFGLYNLSLNTECPNESKYNYFQTLYDYYPLMNNSINNNRNAEYRASIQSYQNELDSYKMNVYLIYSDLAILIKEINSYTNIEGYNDIWIININECPKGINIITNLELNQEPKCISLNISNNSFECNERYSSLTNVSRICDLIFSISSFINDNNELIFNIEQDINQLSQIYSHLFIEVQSQLNYSFKYISNVNNIYNPLLTAENVTKIHSILDCSYLKSYLNKIYESFDNNLSKDSFIFSAFLLGTCLLCWNSASLSLVVVSKFRIQTTAFSNTELDDKSMFAKPPNLNIVEGGNGDVFKNGEKIMVQKNNVDDNVKTKNKE